MPYDAAGPIADTAAFAAKVADVEREALIDVALWATVPPVGPLDEIAGLVAAGACAFKLSTYETHPQRFPRIPDDQMLRAFTEIAAAGGLAGVHAENDEIVRAGIAAQRAAGRREPLAHARSRPPVAETEAVGRCVELAAASGVRLHVCHATLGRSVALATGRDADVTVETCPHYLVLDESDLERIGGEAKINPPLRPRAEVDALWAAIAAGTLGIVSSDHVGWPAERKHGDDIFALASGAPGLEVMLALVHDALRTRGLGLAPLARLLCEAPARRFGLWPRKGALAEGADADIAILDPGVRWTLDPARMVTPAGWSPYAGRSVQGRVTHVLSRGELVYAGGALCARPGRGRFVPAATGAVQIPA
jgi:allantoinase